MVIVNNPGDWKYIYTPLKHPPWDGLSIADLVFPFFILAVGVSIPFSLDGKRINGFSGFELILFILRRTFIIFGIGIFLNSFPYFVWEDLRIPGVLQRIALMYFFLGMIHLYVRKLSFQIFLFVSILFGYYYVIVWIPPPDFPSGQKFSYNAHFNYAAFIDRSLLNGHLWKYTKTWDPEGILSTFASLGTGILGLWLHRYWLYNAERIWKYATCFLVAGILFHWIFPVNKSIWTSSFILVTGGLGLLVVFLLGHIPSRVGEVYGSPIIDMGRSALFVFVWTGILSRLLVMEWKGFVPKHVILKNLYLDGDPYIRSFFYSILYLVFVFLSLYLYRYLTKLIRKIVPY